VRRIQVGEATSSGGYVRVYYDVGDGTTGQPLRSEGFWNLGYGPDSSFDGFVSFWNRDGSLDVENSGRYDRGTRVDPSSSALNGAEGRRRGYWIRHRREWPVLDLIELFLGEFRGNVETFFTPGGHYDHERSRVRRDRDLRFLRSGHGYWVELDENGVVDAEASHYYEDGVRTSPAE